MRGGNDYEYRPTLVRGELQWVLRPVYRLAYFIQRFIRRVRAAMDFWNNGYSIRMQDGGRNWTARHMPITVDLTVPRVPPGEF